MPRHVVRLLAIAALAGAVLAPAPATSAVRSVCIDPGHGGADTGTSNGGILEKDLNLDVALRLGGILEGQGYVVHYTRTDDASPSRSERAQYCNSKGASILVSVHHNGSSNPATDYSTALYQKRIDRALARSVVDAVAAGLGTPNRGIMQFASGVLVKSDMPATISEGYFLTNNDQLAKLNDPTRDYRQEEAQALSNGIAAYFPSR
jgi:N-acetylmuramoyl-L-alanine amidase